MSRRHTLVITSKDWPYYLSQTDWGYQITVRDLKIKTRPVVVAIDDDGIPIYGDAKPIGTWWGAPVYTYPCPIEYRDDYRPRHAKRRGKR